jgi:FixJ family two-component response regulator
MTTRLHNGLIAIVEDDPAMRKSIARLLRAHGYATAAFASAEDFLVSDAADRASGLVLDNHLPGMSGIELCRRLRGGRSGLPVVFVTAYEDEAAQADALAAGCVDYLQKPFEAERLIEALQRSTAPSTGGRT